MKFVGEGEYNLNVLKEISVTDSYLGLDQEDRHCQNKEPHGNCTTRQYRKTYLQKCGCVPLNIRLFNEVCLKCKIFKVYLKINISTYHILGNNLHFCSKAGLCEKHHY